MTKDRKLYYPKRACRHRVAFNHGYRSAASAQTGEEYFPRQGVQKSTVYDLVYTYLYKIADRDRKWKQRNSACNKFRRQHARRKDIRERSLTTIWTDLDGEIGDSNKSKSCTDKNIPLKTLKTCRSSSKECIADCTEAVRDGRRRAKFYLRDALLYGLQSGLLIPIDRYRNILRVSQKLGLGPLKNLKENKEKDRLSIRTNDTEYFGRDR